mmetsp:Transcript_19428/g.61660  ORF Transcript_19428/g.61660 Transcript_19428/m.61660 type:complete len:228 (-) Transcript_19428:17-700(-)
MTVTTLPLLRKLHAFLAIYQGLADPCFGCSLTGMMPLSVALAAAPAFVSLLAVPLFAALGHCSQEELELPPVLCAVLSTLFVCLEVALAACPFAKIGWVMGVSNVLLYKLTSLGFFSFLAELWLRRGLAGAAVKHWLWGIKLQWDIIVSLTVLLPLLLTTMWHRLRTRCTVSEDGTDRCGVHNLFVFRAAGEYRRRRVQSKRYMYLRSSSTLLFTATEDSVFQAFGS